MNHDGEETNEEDPEFDCMFYLDPEEQTELNATETADPLYAEAFLSDQTADEDEYSDNTASFD